MNEIEGVLQAIYISLLVAIFLLNTGRVVKAIAICKEGLILINTKALGEEKQFGKLVYHKIYGIMFRACCLISDYTNAIKYGRELLVICRERGETGTEGKITMQLACILEKQCKYADARELWEKAINIMTEISDRKGQANAYGKFGDLSYRLGEYDKTKEYFEKALSISVEIGDRKGEAICYGNLGNVFKCLGEYEKAKEYLEKALAMTIINGNKKEEARCCGSLGTVFLCLGEHGKAKEYLEKALAIEIETGDRRGEVFCYGNLGTVFESLGEYDTAKKYLETALVISIETGERDLEAGCYGNLGTMFESLAEYDKAKEYFEKALAIQIELGERKGEAICYGNLGIVFKSRGEYDKAREYLEKQLAILMEIGDRAEKASCYRKLGTVFESLGEYHKAKEYLEKELAIRIEIGDRNGEAASCCGNLGIVFKSLAEYDKAKEYLERALAIRIEIGDRAGEATDYGNLGTVFKSLGEYEKAKEYFEKSLAIRIEIGNRAGEVTDYGNLGTVFQFLGEYDKAKEYLEKALSIASEIGHRAEEAACYGNLGTLFQSLREYDKAKEYLEKALAISIEIGDRAGEAADYGNLGTVFQSLGEYERAKEYLERALAIRIEVGDRTGEAADYGNLGSVFQSLGEYEKAKKYLEKALAIRIEIGDRVGEATDYGRIGAVFIYLGEHFMAEGYLKKSLSVSQDIGDVDMEIQCYWSLLCLRVTQKRFQEAYDYLLLSFKKIEDLRGFLRDNDEFKTAWSDAHCLAHRGLSAFLCVSGNSSNALYVLELARARALADLMATQYSVKRQISADQQSWIGIENIMKNESSCACLYISYHAQEMFLWILTTSGVIHFRRITVNENIIGATLVSSLEIFLAKSFRSFGISPQLDCEDRSLNSSEQKLNLPQEEQLADLRLLEEDDHDDYKDPEPSLPLLYKMIIAPVADLLEEPEIIIVPVSSLYEVPFAALSDESGKYLSETFSIRTVPSLWTLKLIQDSPADYHSQTGALIVGDPVVGRVRYKGRVENFKPLPCARKEAEMIGRLLTVQPLTGQNATKKAVLQEITSASLIHFAAHGNAERGEIALSPVRTAGGIPEEEDYLLTMSDISQAQLRAKLVVLSCCHSACGQIRAEGVIGIARAFLGSGARSVLVALWAIEDRATEELMRCFYEHLVRGESASESLHEAMKWMRANGFAKVSEWAPFILIGDNVTFDFGK